MNKWINKKVISCGKIMRLRASVIECQCPECKRWCVKWEEVYDYDFCPHCGKSMRGGENE